MYWTFKIISAYYSENEQRLCVQNIASATGLIIKKVKKVQEDMNLALQL